MYCHITINIAIHIDKMINNKTYGINYKVK